MCGWYQTRRAVQASRKCFGGSWRRYESRREQRQYQCSGVHLPAQRRSAGQESGRRTGWMIQPGAPEMLIAEEGEAFDFLYLEERVSVSLAQGWDVPGEMGR